MIAPERGFPRGSSVAVCLALLAAPGLGQTPAAAPETTAEPSSAPPAERPPSFEELLPEGLRDRLPTPFATGVALDAHALRGLRPDVATAILTGEDGGPIAIEVLALPLPLVAAPVRDVAEEAFADDAIPAPTGGPVPGAAESVETIAVTAPAESAGKVRVPVLVEIDGPSFLDSNQADLARVEVYAYAIGPGKAVADYLGEVFALDVGSLGEAVWQSGLKYHGQLELSPGSYTVRVLVKNFQSSATGLATVEVTVPPPGAGAVLPPVFPGPERRDGWIAVREAGGELARAYPFVAGRRAVSPAARPVLLATRPAALFAFFGTAPGHFAGARLLLTPASGGTPVAASVELASGEPAAERPSGAAALLEALPLRVVVPELETGLYRAELELLSTAGEPRRSAALPVLVLDAELQDREVLWTDLRWRLGEGEGETEAMVAARAAARIQGPTGSRRSVERAARALAEGYRTVLTRLAEGPLSAARTQLLELESQALAEKGGGVEALRSAELQVAQELVGEDPEILVPAMRLHEELYRIYTGRRLFSLVGHSRLMVETLAELYARHGGSPTVAASVLASLGGYLQEANLPSGSRRMFLRALAHDPAHEVALLGLAVGLERHGLWRETLPFLERLTEAAPEGAEGWLRLALNLERCGDPRRSREILGRVVGMEAPGWVEALAYTELARSRLAAGRLDAAAELLEAGLAKMPRQQGLATLLAHVYDRQRATERSLELLRGLTPAAGPYESPRRVYDSWPRAAYERVRRLLEEAASQRLGSLSRVLGGSGGEVEEVEG